MKIKKSELKEIVVEELETYLSELAPCHNPKTGFFDDCDAGAVYSLSEPAVKKAGLDSKYAKKELLQQKAKLYLNLVWLELQKVVAENQYQVRRFQKSILVQSILKSIWMRMDTH